MTIFINKNFLYKNKVSKFIFRKVGSLMINATNFAPSITANNGLTNSIAPVEKKYITIDGQQYDVKKTKWYKLK